MAMKRKADDASVYSYQQNAKQMKLVPFPSSEHDMDMDMDVPMCDAPAMNFDSLNLPTTFHSRLPSSASTVSSDSSSDASVISSPSYPCFDLYPASELASSTAPTAPVDGRLFSGLGFAHARPGCKQLPKLRVACGAGPGGHRSMFGMCEECGAIQILDS